MVDPDDGGEGGGNDDGGSDGARQPPGPRTLPLPDEVGPGHVRRFALVIAEGARAGTAWESTGARCAIGSHPSSDVVLDDPTVSRFHCEVEVDALGARVRDLGSRNGTFVDGVRARDVYLRDGSLLRLGRVSLRFQLAQRTFALPVSPHDRFGALVGASIAMRATFALLERAAATDSTVLLEGETGTGKEAAAASLHEVGGRRDQPFVVVDCAAIPPSLLEAELFGHEKGAFTGAAGRRVGAFEEAAGGTIFLDEIGELPLELQPKLLRVLEQRQVRRLGANQPRAVDLRIIAATNRDLRVEVNEGRFRSDLYYRLAVVKIRLPALRERPEDIPPLVEQLLTWLGAGAAERALLLEPAFLASLQRAAWPGNVRELRNHVERCLVFAQPMPLTDDLDVPGRGASDPGGASRASLGVPSIEVPLGSSQPYAGSRDQAMRAWERAYVEALLAAHDHNVERAARAAGIGRAYLYRLISRHRSP